MKPTACSKVGPLLAGLSATTLVAITPGALADEATEGRPQADKSKYHLFNPTPRDLMREMSTDRPDKTESPYTVDAGHFQIEMDVVNYTYDREKFSGPFDVRTEAWAVAPMNLKVGLCNRVDLQLVLETWNEVRSDLLFGDSVVVRNVQRGFGDITARLKCNFWGNDGGTTAFAAMPFVKIPTNEEDLGNNNVEGGLILPLAVQLPYGFGMGLMTEFDVMRDGDDDGYHPEFVNSITFSHDIVGDLGGYVEFWSLVSTEEDSEWQGTFDVGLTYGLTDNVQLDTGVNIGVTDSADDVNPFVGISWRF